MKLRPIIGSACAAVLLAGTAAQAQIKKSSTDQEPCCNITNIDLSTAVVTATTKAGRTFQFKAGATLLKALRVGQSVSADFTTGKVTVNGIAPCCAILQNVVKPAEPVGTPNKSPAEPITGVKGQRDPAEPVNGVKEQVKPIDPINGVKSQVKPVEPVNGVKSQVNPATPINDVKEEVKPAEPCCSITAINAATGTVTAQKPNSRATFVFQVKDARLLGSLRVGQKVFADFMTARVSIRYGEPCCSIVTQQ